MIKSVSYGNHGATVIEVFVTNEAEMRASLEEFFEKSFAPKPNKIQKYVYGEDRLKNMDRNILKDIVDNNRGMGNTTAHAMKQVAEAIQNPGKAIKLVSDHGEGNPRLAGYLNVVQELIIKLDLKFMVIRAAQQTLTFEV